MRALFDVNAAVHLIYGSYEHHLEMRRLAAFLLGSDDGSILFNASSLNELYYILRHNPKVELRLDHHSSIKTLRSLVSRCELIETTADVVQTALRSDEPDYEDAVVRAAAETAAADAIITYDRKAFRLSPIPSLTAGEAMARFR